MRINGLKYLRRFNKGNYEHEEYGIDVAVNEGENALGVMAEMKLFVEKSVDLKPAEQVPTESVVTEEEVIPKNKEQKTKQTSKNKKADSEKVQISNSKPTDAEVAEVAKKQMEDSSPEVKEEPKEEKKTKPRTKVTAYDRQNPTHKMLLGEFLDISLAGWRNNPTKAVEASRQLEGKDFLDGQGQICEEFKKLFLEKAKS